MAFYTLFDSRFLCILLSFLFSLSLSGPSAFSQSPMQVAGTATKVASSSGNWTSASTWGGSLPSNDDRVLIPNGTTVTVDGMIAQEFKSVRIDNGGKLIFSTEVDTELRTEYLFSGMMGSLEIGTDSNPVQAGVTASLVFAERGGTSSSFDPNRFAPGAVLMGTTEMHGSEKTAWLALQVHPMAGSTQIVLDYAPSGWQVGDQLVVAGTDPITNASINNTNELGSDEVVTITNISGNTISFTPALTKDHKPPAQASDLDVHVANLSRNIVISSENTSVSSISGAFRKPRGHVMFMHTLNVNVKYVEANNLGRTDKTILLDDWDFEELARGRNTGSPVPNGGRNPRGRYSFHFHRGGLDESVYPARPTTPLPTPARVEGCVVNTDPGWGYVNHSSRVDFVKNVAYNVTGGAFNTEAGNETGSFVENIAIRTINPNNPILSAPRPRDSYTDGGPTQALSDINEGRQDFAWQGDGFWLHGTGVTVRGNVVAGCTGHAYVYWTDGLIEKGMGMARGDIDAHVPASEFPTLNQALKDWKATYPTFVLDIWYLKSRPFVNNTAYGFARGVQTYYVHTEFHQSTDTETNDPEEWFNDLPAIYKDQLDLVLDNTTLWNIGKVGFEHNHTANVTIQNSRIVGYGSRTGFENYGTNPAPNHVSYEPEVIGLDLDFFHNTHRWNLNNNTIEGFAGNAVGVALPINAKVTVNGGTFNNSGTDILIGSPDRHLEEDGFGDAMLSTRISQSEILIQGNISFQNPNKNIVMDPQLFYHEIDGKGFPLLGGSGVDDLFFFAPQEITLNFGPFDNSRAYFNEQDANYKPITSGPSGNRCSFGEEVECINNRYVDKTNTQLKSQYNRSFAGAITPNTAMSHAMIIGGKVTNVSTSDPCEGVTPQSPSSLSAQNNNCTSNQLSWPSVQCANSYLLQKRIDSGSWYTLSSSVTGTSYTDINSSTGILEYRLRAQNANGHSSYVVSNSINCSDDPPVQYTLSLSTIGNGTISLNPVGGIYDEGTVVTLTANPNADSQFDNWSGDLSGSNNPITITMDGNKSVVANFSIIDMEEECEWTIIDFNDFESGWGIWNDGGSDCRRSARDDDYSTSGRYCVRLRDNTNSSVMTTEVLDLSEYEEIAIEFNYFARSMDNANEDFWLQISTNGGDDFTTVEEWNKGDEFDNDEFYTDVVNISSMSFSDNTVIRFKCDASGNSDWVYIDDVKISGCTKMQDDDGEPEFQDIINFSFEEPGEGDFEDDFSRIPGWNKGGDGDSGIEKGWIDPTDGEWMCYHEAGDNYIHQTLDLVIESGQTYTLLFDAINMEEEAKAQILLRYGSINIVNKTFSLTHDWENYSVSFNSDDFPSAIGQKLKIFFRNKGEDGSYAGFDNFILSKGQEFSEESNDRSFESGQIYPERAVIVYPNPVIQGTEIKLNATGFDLSAWYSIHHINGKMIQQGPLHRVNRISTTGLQSGIYILRISDKNGAKTLKFIVQNI